MTRGNWAAVATGILDPSANWQPAFAPLSDMRRPPSTRRSRRVRATNGTAPRTQRGQATKDALVRAARDIFERDGFLDARITDITALANTATGSFYSYFSSKEEIFTALIDKLNEEEGLHPPSLAFLSDSDGDLVASVAEHHREYLLSYGRNANLMSVMEQVTSISDSFRRHRTKAAQRYMNANADAIRKLQAAGLADPALEPVQAARSLSTMVSRSAFVHFVLEEEPADSVEVLVTTLTRLWLNALQVEVDPTALSQLD